MKYVIFFYAMTIFVFPAAMTMEKVQYYHSEQDNQNTVCPDDLLDDYNKKMAKVRNNESAQVFLKNSIHHLKLGKDLLNLGESGYSVAIDSLHKDAKRSILDLLDADQKAGQYSSKNILALLSSGLSSGAFYVQFLMLKQTKTFYYDKFDNPLCIEFKRYQLDLPMRSDSDYAEKIARDNKDFPLKEKDGIKQLMLSYLVLTTYITMLGASDAKKLEESFKKNVDYLDHKIAELKARHPKACCTLQ